MSRYTEDKEFHKKHDERTKKCMERFRKTEKYKQYQRVYMAKRKLSTMTIQQIKDKINKLTSMIKFYEDYLKTIE